jgi:hypothetical protein
VRHELYDLAEDPGERRDLLAAGGGRPADLEALVEKLDAYHELREAERRRLTGASTGDEEAPPLDPERREKLRALGYLE